VISYAVARRRAEIGLHIALGAGRRSVLGLVLRQGMTPVAAGLAGGALAAFALEVTYRPCCSKSARTMQACSRSQQQCSPLSQLACWILARRAAGVNPLAAIRFE
jgi:putative ABC transport system permease protein